MTGVERSGGELLVTCLEAQGVTTSYGVPGESYLAILDALHDSDIRFVACRQEGGAAYAAEAHGKLTGRPGVAFVTRGPGATNASVGIHTAMQDSTPMVLFVGQAASGHLGREAFQEVDYRAFFGPLAKWATQVDDADRIPEIVARAFATARSGRPGPVVVALPEDVLTTQTVAAPTPMVRVSEPAPSSADLAKFVALLETAVRPLILAGGGGWSESGRHALEAFVRSTSVPVATVFRYNDLVDNHLPQYVGDAGVGMPDYLRDMITEADLLIVTGGRLGEMATAGWTLVESPVAKQRIVHVHPADSELGKSVYATLPVHAGVNEFWSALSDAATGTGERQDTQWCTDGRAAREQAVVAPPQPGNLDMAAVMTWLQANLPGDVIITNGAGNFTAWPNRHFTYGADARLLAPQSGSMGYGLPAAIAAKVVEPDRMVVCFAGDGDLQMNVQELGTAMQEGAAPIVLVLNNGMYGTIRMHQERSYPGRVSGTQLLNPDFVQLAGAYGFHAEQVVSTDEFGPAFERATASTSGALLELMIPPEMLTPTFRLAAE